MSDYFSRALRFQGDDDGVTPTAGSNTAQSSASAATDYFGRALRSNEAHEGQPEPQTPEAQPSDTRSWGRRAIDAVRGREDPAYAGLSTFDEDMQAEAAASPSLIQNRMLRSLRMGAMTAPGDAAYADIMQSSLGDRFIRREKDKYGTEIMVYRGPDGAEKKAYVNRPGLDTEDVGRGVASAIPYVVGATAVGKAAKGAGWLGRSIYQGLTAGATSVGQDVASTFQGSQQGIDVPRAAITAGFGAGGEVGSAAGSYLWRRFITEPRLFNKQTGTLTQQGEELARSAGLDPADITREVAQEFAKTYARTRDRTLAGQTATVGEFKIPVTQGQRYKDPQMLLNEKAMRYGVYGQDAKGTMQNFDRLQRNAVEDAALGSVDDAGNATGVAPMLAGRPTSLGAMPRPGETGEAVRSGMREAQAAAKAGEKKAWDDVGELIPQKDAFDNMPDMISGRLGSLRVDDKVTPKAFGMAEDLDNWIAGKAASDGPKVLKQQPVRSVDDMRRRLLAQYKGAGDDADRAAAKAVYDGFNDWIDDAANKSLLSGDAQAAANLRAARDTTKELKAVFGERDASGKSSPGRRIVQDILDKADTPESIVAKLFGNQGFDGAPKQGTMEALQLIKTGLDRYADKATATGVWNDIRLALWQRMVQTKPGDLHTPTIMAKNIDSAMRGQASVLKLLYSPEELRTIRNFSRAMKEISYKDPNPSGSGTAAAYYTSQFGQAVLSLVGMQNGPIGKIFQTILNATPIKGAIGQTAAQSATSQAAPAALRPVLAPYTTSVGSQLEQR